MRVGVVLRAGQRITYINVINELLNYFLSFGIVGTPKLYIFKLSQCGITLLLMPRCNS